MDFTPVMVAPEKARVSQAEFMRLLALPENRERQLELWDGEIIETMPTWGHGTKAAQLIIEIGIYLRNHSVGAPGIEVQIALPDEDYAPIPDLCVVLNREGIIDQNEALPFMPDVVVEIQSPDQSDKFMREKGDWYIAHGCRMVIIVYLKPIVEVQTLTERTLLTIDDTLDGGDVLPGFSVEVARLYPQ